MSIEYRVSNQILHVIFPPSKGTTWSQKQDQFLNDQKRPEHVYTNYERCFDILRASARYEGENQFVGFNFPSSIIRKMDVSLYPYKHNVTYVIGYMKGDTNTMEHEKRHARFYIDRKYRKRVHQSWNKLRKSNPKKHKSIINKLKKDGYDEKVYIDEFQAYYPNEIK
jgi:hypothetical protein